MPKLWLILFLATTLQAQSTPATVRINVLSLFHPQTLILTTPQPVTLLIGMCQLAAADQAAHGATAATILAHFYPNTHLTTLSNAPPQN